MTLRGYQAAVVDAFLDAYDRGLQAPVGQLATGSGKTVIAAELARRHLERGRVLVLAPREEIVRQTAQRLADHCGVPVGIEMAGERAGDEPIVVGSVATVGQRRERGGRMSYPRLEHLDPGDFALLIDDECHHNVPGNRTWASVSEWAGLTADGRRTGRGPRRAGFTATLRRSDNLSLAGVYDEVVADVSLPWLIEQGYLAPVVGDRLRWVEEPRRDSAIVTRYLERYTDRQFIAFLPRVSEAHRLAALFRSAGVACAALDGGTPAPEREALLEGLKRGDLRGIANVGVLTEGTDLPMVSLIVWARPTQSDLLYTQGVGRGTRLFDAARWNADPLNAHLRWEGERYGLRAVKADCTVLDVVGASERRALMGVPALVGSVRGASLREEAPRRRPLREYETPVLVPVEVQGDAFDPLGFPALDRVVEPEPYRWYAVREGWRLWCDDGASLLVTPGPPFWVVPEGVRGPTTVWDERLGAFDWADRLLRRHAPDPTGALPTATPRPADDPDALTARFRAHLQQVFAAGHS